ncbi:MAG TPA: hypothetical protein VFY49_00020 [Myxococcota bacterium]|nr:hypothetical protein [Myxococcota bacterium]
MARIVGNLVPEDDYTHPLGPEPNFNESMYFNFFDRARKVGGFVRLGNRANEGRAEMTTTLYLPDGRVLFTFGRPQISHNDAFDAGGMRFDVEEPTQRLRTRYSGELLELKDPRAMADPRRAFSESPRKKVELDLVHEAVGPMYGGQADREETERDASQQFAKAHYEQHMAVKGGVTVDGERIPIDGFGLRDHSWGPRFWQAIHSYEWLTLNFGPDFGAMLSIIRRDPSSERVGGVVVRGDSLDNVKRARVTAEFEPNGLYHKKVAVALDTAGGEHLDITGEVVSFIPLRNRRDGMVTHIGEGMTEWRCGDRVGYGLSEFLRQVK